MNQERNFRIDVARGVSILFVILLHINIRVPFQETALGAAIPNALYKVLFWSGAYGVNMFFVMSGFLITTSVLYKWGEISAVRIGEFYRRRFVRIAPLLFLLLAILSGLHLLNIEGYVLNEQKVSLGEALFSALTFNINGLEMKVGYLPASWDILWSLSIEEVFYIIFPILCLLCRKNKYFILLMGLLVLIAPLFRSVWFTDNELGERNNFACMDGLALGCIAAIVVQKTALGKKQLRALQFVGWALIITVMFFRSTLYQSGISKIGLNVSLLSIGMALLLIYWQAEVNRGNNQKHIALGWLAGIGKNSYEIYLTHMFIVLGAVSLFELIKTPTDIHIYLLYGTTILLSALLGNFFVRLTHMKKVRGA